jgi:probable F420-dependent oxidoreductase
MRYGIALPNYGPLAGPDSLVRLARHAEAVGIDSVWVADHVVIPAAVDSIYPYDRSPQPGPARLQRLEEFYDALTTLAFIAGTTTRVRLGVSVYVVPIRNPLLTAKMVATLDALSHGRLIFGVGAGWLREEFTALHASFEDREALTDEYLRICQAAWTREVTSLDGPRYVGPAVHARPKPQQRPHPPIWIGGNSLRALRRTVRLGTGWHPIDLSPAQITDKRARLVELCAAAGRDPTEITLSLRTSLRFGSGGAAPSGGLAGAPARIRAGVAAYAAAGVEYLVVGLPAATTLDQLLTDVDRLATEVITHDLCDSSPGTDAV